MNNKSKKTEFEIGSIELGSGKDLRVLLQRWKEHWLVSVRVWSFDREGQPKPTRNGINISAEQIPAMRRMLRAAEKKARKTGILPPQEEE